VTKTITCITNTGRKSGFRARTSHYAWHRVNNKKVINHRKIWHSRSKRRAWWVQMETGGSHETNCVVVNLSASTSHQLPGLRKHDKMKDVRKTKLAPPKWEWQHERNSKMNT